MRFKGKTMFIHTNKPLITSFYIKKVSIFAELAMSRDSHVSQNSKKKFQIKDFKISLG